MNWVLIFLGGGAGSMARFGLGELLGKTEGGFPLGTIGANILACFILGFIWSGIDTKNDESKTKSLLITGFCGGFSTFSTFSLETVTLFQNNKPLMGGAYMVISLLICFLAICLGFWIGRKTLA